MRTDKLACFSIGHDLSLCPHRRRFNVPIGESESSAMAGGQKIPNEVPLLPVFVHGSPTADFDRGDGPFNMC